ncbi:hypothetical protein JOD24_003154 [Kroppenstedtia sanguinis]|uniref:Uncharacterized protein n=1 Tax=Kroppenstedtia sanguinis TaxID=1380684 RepID=A0ABW4CC75_9BACL
MADQERKEREHQAQNPAGEKVSLENGWDPYGSGAPDASVNQYGYDPGYWQQPGAVPQPAPYGGWQTSAYPSPCSEAQTASSPGFAYGTPPQQHAPAPYPSYPHYPSYYFPYHYNPYHHYHPYPHYPPHYPHYYPSPYPGSRRSTED